MKLLLKLWHLALLQYVARTDADWCKIHPTDDWESIGTTFKQLAQQVDLRAKICEDLQKFAEEELNWKRIVKKVADYL